MSEQPPSPWDVGRIEPGPSAAISQAPPSTSSGPVETSGGAEVGAAPPTHQLWSRTTLACPDRAAGLVWVGAHGGAGVTSLAATTGVALTRCWPDPTLGWPAKVAVVCRSNAAGLDAAAQAIQEVVSDTVPDLQLVALVVVADAPKRPSRRITARIHELAATVSTVVHVPWITSWREDPYSPQPAVTKAATTIAKENLP
ncbi:MAG: DUF6668 family protein [Nocardioides sp.]